MKKGLVLHVGQGKATLLRPGGNIVHTKARPGWQKGDVVTLPAAGLAARRVIAVAASFLLLLGTLGAYGYVNTAAALVSVDMLPSLELTLNRLGRVKATTAYNAEASALLAEASLTGMPYGEALAALLQAETAQEYLRGNASLDISIYAAAGDGQALAASTEAALQLAQQAQPQLQTYCHMVDGALVESAHAHGMTSGRYAVFLQLQEVDPSITAEDVAHCHTGDMRSQMGEARQGSGGHRHRHGHH